MIRIEIGNSKLANTIVESLSPEVNITQKAGTKISIDVEDSVLILCFEAQSIARLRAVCNSYLRWIVTILNTLETSIKQVT